MPSVTHTAPDAVPIPASRPHPASSARSASRRRARPSGPGNAPLVRSEHPVNPRADAHELQRARARARALLSAEARSLRLAAVDSACLLYGTPPPWPATLEAPASRFVRGPLYVDRWERRTRTQRLEAVDRDCAR
jgi:hypothetical protein